MKVALLTPGFSSDEQDDCIPALLALVRALGRRGCEVHVFTLRYPPRRDRYRVAGATVHALGGGTSGGLRRPVLLARALLELVREHRRAPFAGLHAIWADEPGFVAAAAGRLLGCPSVVTLFGGELVALPEIDYGAQRSRLSRPLIAAALRGAGFVGAGSSHLADLAAGTGLVAGDRLQRFAIGVDAEQFQPGPAEPLPGRPSLLHVASLVPVKDQRTLLEAVAAASRSLPSLHLHVVGDGPLRGELEMTAVRLGLGRHVTFHGARRHAEVAAFYRGAEACIQSSRHEGQQLVILEAAACERVTLGTRVGLLGDLAPPACTADPGDVAGLAQAIVRSARDPARLRALGQRARDRFLRGYTIEHTVDRLLELFARRR